MLKNKYILTLIIGFIGFVANAQTLSYDSIKTMILSSNPELEMYNQQAKAFDAMSTGAKAWDAPQVGMGFFMTPYNTSYWKPQVMTVDGMNSVSSGMGNFMIQGKQMIPNPAKLNANQKYMQAMSGVEMASKNSSANNMFYETKKLYHSIQIINRKLKIFSEAEQTLASMISLGEGKVAYNQETLSSIYKAKSQKAQIENERIMLENEAKMKMYYIASYMNKKGEFYFKADTQLVVKNYENLQIDTSLLETNRSDLLVLEKNIQVTQLKQKAEQYKSRPDFGIEFGQMFAFGSNPNQFTLMGMMTLPLVPWSSNMYKSNVLAANYQIQAYHSQKKAIMNESVGMLYGIKSELTSTKKQLDLFKTVILPSLKKSYDLALLAYNQNTGELFQALDARMNLQMTQIQYEELLLKLLFTQAEYEKQLQLY